MKKNVNFEILITSNRYKLTFDARFPNSKAAVLHRKNFCEYFSLPCWLSFKHTNSSFTMCCKNWKSFGVFLTLSRSFALLQALVAQTNNNYSAIPRICHRMLVHILLALPFDLRIRYRFDFKFLNLKLVAWKTFCLHVSLHVLFI